ncbi:MULTISPECIES: hypothetical protein [Rhodobacterales]|uniref:hypothetical protein n=1 Tax=Rhodobacterales TaxID=204455 RepID=UPI0006D6C712|nr:MULTISPECIES: hypothetical protein [Rhodobacterales]KPD10485.1 hypothetical protein AN476_20690 [Phaeobacter sp. 11ANDIMAR09]
MRKTVLIAVGGLSLVTAAYIWTATNHWYDSIPGVSLTGPLNFHFAKDVALAYLASGAALVWAGVKHDRSAGLCGALWLVFHAVFHIWIWIHRGSPMDVVALTNLTGIQLPAFLAMWAAISVPTERVTA